MGYSTPDLYNQPEQFGLKIVGSVEWQEPCYSFDTTVVWEGLDESGVIYYVASDAGCSCPSPFDGLTSLDKVDFASRKVHDVIDFLNLRNATGTFRSEEDIAGAQAEIMDITSKLMRR